MTRTQARRWAFAAAVAGLTADALFIAFYVSFAVQHFAEPHGVAAVLGSAADYAGIPQNALLAVTTGVVFRFLSHQRRSDRVVGVAGATAFVTAAAGGVLTVTGLLPGVSSVAVGAGLAAGVVAVVWAGLIAGALAWLSIPRWLLILGRATAQEPSSAQEVCDDVIRPHP